MKFENRQTQFPGRKRVRRLNSDNQQVEEYFVLMENAEGTANPEGTPVNSENLGKANWRDDKSISFRMLDENEPMPVAKTRETQIVTTADGETWIIPPGSILNAESHKTSGAKATNASLGTVKGSLEGSGVVSVEDDGRMTVRGWNDMAVSLNNHIAEGSRHLGSNSIDRDFSGALSDSKVPSSLLVHSILQTKAPLVNGKIDNPLNMPWVTSIDSAMELLGSFPSTMYFRTNNYQAGQPFPQLGTDELCILRISAQSATWIEIEASALDASNKTVHAVRNRVNGTYTEWCNWLCVDAEMLSQKANRDASGRMTDVAWCGVMNFNDATAKALSNPQSRFSFQCDPTSAGNPFKHTNYLIIDMWATSATSAMAICYDNVRGYRATREYWGTEKWRGWKTRKAWETIYEEFPEIDISNGTSNKFGILESGKEATFRLTIRRDSYYQMVTVRFSNNGYGVCLYDAPVYNENQVGYRMKTIFSRENSSSMRFRTLYSFMTSDGNTNWTQQGTGSYFIVKIEKEAYT